MPWTAVGVDKAHAARRRIGRCVLNSRTCAIQAQCCSRPGQLQRLRCRLVWTSLRSRVCFWLPGIGESLSANDGLRAVADEDLSIEICPCIRAEECGNAGDF